MVNIETQKVKVLRANQKNAKSPDDSSCWFFVGNGGMDYGDYYWGLYTGLLSNQGEKKYKLVFHNGSFKKTVLKYGAPKPYT